MDEVDPSGSDGAQWVDLVIPDDGERLLAELHARGIAPGQRVRVRIPSSPAV